MDGVLGLGGWQWVFILEAVPAVLLGFVSFVWLTDRPEHAGWLSPAEKQWLTGKVAMERSRATKVPRLSVWKVALALAGTVSVLLIGRGQPRTVAVPS